ncbi:MAG: chlorophyll synthesis pathway protein BchC [Granulosicoccus sp.]
MSSGLSTNAIVFEQPGKLALRSLVLKAPESGDLVVDIEASGISTGTEKLLWTGTMPAFPGLSYPLVPGYEAVGVVRQAGDSCSLKPGDRVFVPGANCYEGDVRGLFGASAATLVVSEARVIPVGSLATDQATLLALAATAMHILSYRLRQEKPDKNLNLADIVTQVPQLIIGHGVLGRLIARISIALGGQAPLVWELDPQRRTGSTGYDVIAPADDEADPRRHIIDVSGACGDHFNQLITKLAKGGRLTLGGFYSEPVNFDFAPAFMREITVGIAAEWAPDDLSLVLALLNAGALSLDGLVSHRCSFDQAQAAYPQAFDDPACLKLILNWSA